MSNATKTSPGSATTCPAFCDGIHQPGDVDHYGASMHVAGLQQAGCAPGVDATIVEYAEEPGSPRLVLSVGEREDQAVYLGLDQARELSRLLLDATGINER